LSGVLFEIIVGGFIAEGVREREQWLPEGTGIEEGDPKLLEAGGNATVFISGDAPGLTGIGALGGGREEDFAEYGEEGELSRVLDMASAGAGGESGSIMLTPDGMESDRAGFG
jgi:hypothetical protein